MTINYKDKYAKQLLSIKDNYKTFDLPYNGKDNDDYVNGQGFCCNDGTPEAAQARAIARTRAANGNFKPNDDYEKMQFYYHPNHLGISSYITNLDGEVSQHIEYVPFGEVFIEEHNNTWNTPYLFNAKEFDEETGMYYYGARYYEPRLSLWMSCDPMQEKYPSISAYTYTNGNPIVFVDIMGLYPKHLLQLHKTSWWKSDYYTFTPVAVHLLSLVSGVNKNNIAKAKVYERSVSHPYPWYGSESYGGITLPEGNGYAITFTNNLFDDNDLGENYYEWLNIASHEVGHINHIDESNKFADANYQTSLEASIYSKDPVIISKSANRIGSYLTKFAYSYIESGGHDFSPLEKQAENGSIVFRNFNKFVNQKYGANSLENLIKSNNTDKYKINKINVWWEDYENQNK